MNPNPGGRHVAGQANARQLSSQVSRRDVLSTHALIIAERDRDNKLRAKGMPKDRRLFAEVGWAAGRDGGEVDFHLRA